MTEDTVFKVVFGAILALLGGFIAEWGRRNLYSGKLSASFDKNSPLDFIAVMGDASQSQPASAWVRVLVRNEKKKAMAADCRAYLTDIRWQAGGQEQHMPIGDSLPLRWSNSGGETVKDIPYGINQFVDLLAIDASSSGQATPQTVPKKYHIPWLDGQVIKFEVTVCTKNRAPVKLSGSVARPAGSKWYQPAIESKAT